MVTTSNKGYTLMADGESSNSGSLSADLQRIDATLNLILEDVYENTSSPQTPTNLEPGQAWFISDDSTLSGDWATAFGVAPGSRDGDIIAIWVQDVTADPTDPEAFTWVSSKVPVTAYGYILARAGRYQLNPATGLWEEQVKEQSCDYYVSFPSASPLVEPTASTVTAGRIMVAPFPMRITAIALSAVTSVVGGSYQGVLPRMAYTLTPSDSFDQWTTLVLPGSANSEGNWGTQGSPAATAISFSNTGSVAPNTVAIVPGTGTVAWETTVIPQGASIAWGGPWAFQALPTDACSQSPSDIQSLQFKITYVQV
jgi:hypothetical protein